MTGPTMVTLKASGGSVPARDVSCSKMNRRVTDQPGPPYSLGQSGAIQPFLWRMRCQSSDCSFVKSVSGLGGRISRPTAKARGRAGEEDIAFAAGKHQPCRFAAREKAGTAGHFPNLAEHAFGRIQNREVDVGADIEDADLQRRVFVRVAKKGS